MTVGGRWSAVGGRGRCMPARTRRFSPTTNHQRPTAAVLLLLAASAAAQPLPDSYVDFSEIDRKIVSPGVNSGAHRYFRQDGRGEFRFVEANLSHARVSLTLSFPADGAWGSQPIGALAKAVDAAAAIGLSPQPPATAWTPPAGLVYFDRRLATWPPAGAHLIADPEGTVQFRDLEPGIATLSFDDGTSIGLASVNGALGPAGGPPALYTGSLDPLKLPASQWATSTVLVPLVPLRTGADPQTLLLDDPALDRRFRPVAVIPREDLSPMQESAWLVFAPPVDAKVLAALTQRRAATITVELSPRESLARLIAPVGDLWLRGGDVLRPEVLAEPLRNILAADDSGRRLMLLASPEPEPGKKLASLAEVKAFLDREGYTWAATLPGAAPMLLADAKVVRDARETAALPARLALGIVAKANASRLYVDAAELVPIRKWVPSGTRFEFIRNQPRAAADGSSARAADLANFWAIPVRKPPDWRPGQDNPDALKLLLPKRQPVASIEIVHAEMGGFSPEFNLKSFEIWGRARSGDRWRQLKVIRHPAPVARERIRLDGNPELGELRIDILEPSFLPGGDVARISEVVVWGLAP
jgi:hypothetical protein